MNIFLKKYKKNSSFKNFKKTAFIFRGISFYFIFESFDTESKAFGLSDISISPICYISGEALDFKKTFKQGFIEELLVSIAESNEDKD